MRWVRGDPEILASGDDDDDDELAEVGLAHICTLAFSSIEHIPPSLHLKIPTTGVECKEARESRILLSAQSNSNNWPSLVPHHTYLLPWLSGCDEDEEDEEEEDDDVMVVVDLNSMQVILISWLLLA